MRPSTVVLALGIAIIAIGVAAPSLLPLNLVGSIGGLSEAWVGSDGQKTVVGPPGAPAPVTSPSGTLYVAVNENPGTNENITSVNAAYCSFVPNTSLTNTGANTCTQMQALQVSQTPVACPSGLYGTIQGVLPTCYPAQMPQLTKGSVYIVQAVVTYVVVGQTMNVGPISLDGYLCYGCSSQLYQPGPSPPPPSYTYPSLLVKVTNRQTGSPVQGALVQLGQAGLSAVTPSTGQVLFSNIPAAGTFTVTVSASGFNTVSENVVLSWNTQAYANIALIPLGMVCASGQWYNITSNSCQSGTGPQPPPVVLPSSCPTGDLYNLTSQQCQAPPHAPQSGMSAPINYADVGLGSLLAAVGLVLRRRER